MHRVPQRVGRSLPEGIVGDAQDRRRGLVPPGDVTRHVMGQHSVREHVQHEPGGIRNGKVGDRAHRLLVGGRGTRLDLIGRITCRMADIRSLSPGHVRHVRRARVTSVDNGQRSARPRRRKESVAERPLNLDARALRSGAEAQSHSADGAPDRARARPRHVGRRSDQLLVGDEPIGVPHERRQDDELEVGEVDRLAARSTLGEPTGPVGDRRRRGRRRSGQMTPLPRLPARITTLRLRSTPP